jgi:uncharacterized protein
VTLLGSLAPWQWGVAYLSTVLIGLTKTGLPGLGILFVPLFALVFPARASTGIVLPLLIVGDLVAVLWYRRHAVWAHLVRLLPWAVAGIVAGFFALGKVNDRQLRPILGALILVLLGISIWREMATKGKAAVPTTWWFAGITGFLAGLTTMMANAAGPVMMLYLLAMRLPKDEFIGTSAWFFAAVNWVKVPFSLGLGLITPPSLAADAILAAGVLVGAVLGIVVVNRLPQRAFSVSMQALTAVAAVLLFF